MTTGQLDNAKRRALNLFDRWVDATGFVHKETSYYYELQSLMEDAVEIGVQHALKDIRKLESEED